MQPDLARGVLLRWFLYKLALSSQRKGKLWPEVGIQVPLLTYLNIQTVLVFMCWLKLIGPDFLQRCRGSASGKSKMSRPVVFMKGCEVLNTFIRNPWFYVVRPDIYIPCFRVEQLARSQNFGLLGRLCRVCITKF